MNILEFFKNNNKVKQIIDSNKLKISDSSNGFNIMLLASDFMSGNSTLFVVLPTLFLAQRYYDELCQILDYDDVLFFPADELISAEMISASGDFLYERIETLFSLIENKKKLVIMNMHAAIKYEMKKETWTNSCFYINNNETIQINELVNKLIKNGYIPVYQVSKTGEFSKRGSIIDIFQLGYDNPIRLDFFGDDIETIKEFDIETQRSIKKIDNALILPVSELLYDENDFKFAKTKILSFIDNFDLNQIEDEMYKKDIFNLSEHKSLDTLSRYLEFFDESKTTIFDFVDNKRIYVIDSLSTSYVMCQETRNRVRHHGITRRKSHICWTQFEHANVCMNA